MSGTGSYHDFRSVESYLQSVAGSRNASVRSLGKSSGGRDLWVVTIGEDGESSPDGRPAIFVGANIVGYHNAGTEAALALIDRLLHQEESPRATWYIAPVLNPDAHDGMFGPVRRKRSGAAGSIDHDNDGLAGEDRPEDLNGDGTISTMRIPDPTGTMLPSPDDPRVMIRADPRKGQVGVYKMVPEGNDDDLDGRYNEDPAEGPWPSRNFANRFAFNDRTSGRWPGQLPESRLLMDFLLKHENIAVAVVFGPANSYLKLPKGTGGGKDLGSLKFKVPKGYARFLGLDPEVKYTIDQIWERAKDLPFVQQNNVTKTQMAQFLGAGPATKPDDDDMKYYELLAKDYKNLLEDAGLDTKRTAGAWTPGGLSEWLYYQYGTLTVELDVWGIPKQEKKTAEGADAPLTLERLEEMTPEEFTALGEEKVAGFLKEIGAPPQFTAAGLIERVASGQVSPKQMAMMARQSGAGSEKKGSEGNAGKEGSDLIAWLDKNHPEAILPWTEVRLADGTVAEVGGLDPFAALAPPGGVPPEAIQASLDAVQDLAGKLARVELVQTETESLGGGVYRITAVARNTGFLPTHTGMARKGKFHLPVRLRITPGDGVTLVTGHPQVTSDRLGGEGGSLKAEWLVRVGGKRGSATLELFSDNAGGDSREIILQEGR